MKILALLLALPLHFAAAQSVDKPTITKEAGKPVVAVWSNGDEAALKFSRGTTIVQVPVPFQVTENLCAPVNGSTFTITMPVRVDQLVWQWTKHHDSTQIGKTVKFKFGPFENDLLRPIFITNGFRFNHADLMLGLPPDSIAFQDLAWLPGFENGTLKPFTISSWMSEGMIPNSQTGLNENRVVSGAYGVHVTPTSPLSGTIDTIDSGHALAAAGDSFVMLGDVVSWIWQNAEGSCQIAMKPNLGPAQAQILQFLNSLRDPFQPYIWNQDTLTGTVETAFIEEELYFAVH